MLTVTQFCASKIREILDAHASAQSHADIAIERGKLAGAMLIEVRARLQYGKFNLWVADNLPALSLRQAQRYMSAAESGQKPLKQDSEPKPVAQSEASALVEREQANDGGICNEANEPHYSELDYAREVIQDLRAEIAVASLPACDKVQAHDIISSLRTELKIVNETLRSVTFSRDSLLAENGEMKRQMAHQRKQIKELTTRAHSR